MSSVLKNEPIAIVCAADDNYAMPLAVSVRSALVNIKNERQVVVFIIDGGIKPHNKRKICQSFAGRCEVKWLTVPDELLSRMKMISSSDTGKLTGAEYVSITSYYRLFISEILPTQFNKVIYLDSDIVVSGDVSNLWEIDIKDNYLLAVQDHEVFCPYVSSPNGLLNWKELGFASDSKYFNAGVLVLNLEKWRSDDMCTKALDYLAKNRQYIRWHDQDILNAIVKGQWGELDRRWNKMDPQRLTSEDVENAYIIHFTSMAKPWSTLEQYAPRDLFYHYLDLTAWSGYRLTLWRRLWRRLKREVNNRFPKQKLQETTV
jgi:lipopolysaccharide biosynthesis glycosyltransferase